MKFIGTLIGQTKELIKEVNSPIKLAALMMVLAFLGFAVQTYTRTDCSFSINSPANNKDVKPSLTIRGKATNCSDPDTIYTIVALDSDGDYYNQGDIEISKSGSWYSVFKFGPSWSGKPAIVKVIGYPKSETWIDESTNLPSGALPYAQVKINVQ